MSHINDPKHWRHRAAEARAMAESLTDPEAKQQMLKLRPTMKSWLSAPKNGAREWSSLDQGVKSGT
jgi:hypothetical protein